ncbi:hypothetical protein BH11MYX4_BH11MYX4_49580 [soil metagenome]
MTPLRTLEGVLAAMSALGLDARRARAAANLASDLRPDDLVPPEARAAVFGDAFAQRPSPELVTELGMATPLGCFGVVDYLAASSTTIEGAMHALATHFSGIQRGARIELTSNEGGHLMENHSPFGPMREELTLAVTVGRFRRLVVGELQLDEVSLRSSHPSPTRHAALFGCEVRLDAPVSSLRLSRASGELPLRTADPTLASTLAAVAEQLGFGGEETPDIERVVRSRLRDLIERGGADAASVARTMGTSERTLHRRLAAVGRSFQEVVDAFRVTESERLLLSRRPLAEIAIALGYSDQSAWSRAWKRWKGVSPSEWRASRMRS